MSHVPKSAEFSLYPSRYFLYAKLGLALVAALIIGFSPLLPWAKTAGLLFFAVLSCGFYRNFRQQLPERLFVLAGDTGSWRLISSVKIKVASGRRPVTIKLQLMPSQFVSESLVILYFKTVQGKRISRVLPRDRLVANEHRLLRKLLLARPSCDL